MAYNKWNNLQYYIGQIPYEEEWKGFVIVFKIADCFLYETEKDWKKTDLSILISPSLYEVVRRPHTSCYRIFKRGEPGRNLKLLWEVRFLCSFCKSEGGLH